MVISCDSEEWWGEWGGPVIRLEATFDEKMVHFFRCSALHVWRPPHPSILQATAEVCSDRLFYYCFPFFLNAMLLFTPVLPPKKQTRRIFFHQCDPLSPSDSPALLNHQEMSSDVIVCFILFVINFVASIVTGMTSFGDAILLHVFWEACTYLAPDTMHDTSLGVDDIKTITEIMYIRNIVFAPILVYFTYKDGGTFSKTMFLMMAVPSLVFGIFGAFLLGVVDEDVLRFVFGVSSLVFGAVYAGARMYYSCFPKDGASRMPKLSDAYDADGRIRLRIKVGGGIAACAAGLMGSLTGVGGPPLIIFILVLNVPSQITRVNYSASGYPAVIARFLMAIFSNLLRADRIIFYATSLAGGGAGLALGIFIGRVIGPTTFSTVVFCLLMLAATVMITSSAMILMSLMVSCLVVVFIVHFREKRLSEVPPSAAASPTTSTSVAGLSMQCEEERHPHCCDELVDL